MNTRIQVTVDRVMIPRTRWAARAPPLPMSTKKSTHCANQVKHR